MTNRRLLFCSVLIILGRLATPAQTLPNSEINPKLQYEDLFISLSNYFDPYLDEIDNSNGEDLKKPTGVICSDAFGYINEALLQNFISTGDKAYLEKFIYYVLKIQRWRQDRLASTAPPLWSGLNLPEDSNNSGNTIPPSMYQDGLTLWPMAHFCYLIEYEYPWLASFSFPPGSIPIPPQLTNPPSSLNLGALASWLKVEVTISLSHLLQNYWESDAEGFRKSPDPNSEVNEINKQSGFGCALAYLGYSHSLFLYHAKKMAEFYLGNHLFYDGTPCLPTGPQQDVFKVDADNAYWWYHAGHKDIRFCDSGVDYIEDLSHGFQTLTFPLACYETGIGTSGVPYFTNDIMTRFHNTFTKNIYTGIPGIFNNAVNGTPIGPIFHNDCANDWTSCLPNLLKNETSLWMATEPWDVYDNSPYDVYNTLLSNYIQFEKESPDQFYSSSANLGLAYLVRTFQKNNCYDLELRNRDLIYDQDFTAPANILVIPKRGRYYNPYVNPPYLDTTTADGNKILHSAFSSIDNFAQTFVINQGVTSNFIAGGEINFKPGFHAMPGSHFKASIDPNLCGGQRKDPYPHPGYYYSQLSEPSGHVPTQSSSNNTFDLLLREQIQIALCPNPANESIQLIIANPEESLSLITIFNNPGQVLYETSTTANSLSVPVASFAEGHYFIQVRNENGQWVKPFVVKR